MEIQSITLLFVAALVAAAVFVTLLVRKDIVAKTRMERVGRREVPRRARGR